MSVSPVASFKDESLKHGKFEDLIRNDRRVPLMMRNGQRITGPPTNWQGPLPSKGSEVFIGKLPLDVTEIELLQFLEKVGTVYQFRLMIDSRGHNKGFGFVTYADPATAQRAVKELDQSYLREHKRIAVVLSIDNRRLFFGGLPPLASAEDILNEVTVRVKNVTNVILYSCANDRARNRGFAFVEFTDHMSAAIARKELQQEEKSRMFMDMNEHGHKIQVDWAVPEPQVDAEQMANVTNLFVRNVSVNVSEHQLLKLFSLDETVEVTRVRRPSNYAFIHFARREDAECAMKKLDGFKLDGLNLEVEWAKPPPPKKDRYNYESDNRYHGQPHRTLGRKGKSHALLPRQKIRHPVADQPMAYPGQALLPASPTYVLPAPIASKPDHMKEVDALALQLFGCTPKYETLTCPMEDGRKQYYPCVILAGQREVVNVVYGDRESALDAAAAHCLARLQATFQVSNMTRVSLAARPLDGLALTGVQASLQAIHLNDGAIHTPMMGFVPPDHVPVRLAQLQAIPRFFSGMPCPIIGGPSYHHYNTMG
ncbi:probable RNA-binding protein 46 isoform X2 [Varroa jacobsoni]|uniref:probable RNA-binding protein 46 isoform X2 n=1 Tax=Varroa jacobsoni TaxID=62625 RepID=UPI000BFA153A|nr:probable RNA-binding protein 46 isoform X2 [Varroa jacobsoni]